MTDLHIEIEQELLGAILVNNDAYWYVRGFLKPWHFRTGLHWAIFEASAKLIEADKEPS
jgi:replicative DNA helicase